MRTCLILSYFGLLPNYFQVFLNSCSRNESFNWLIITDDNRDFFFPKNVTRIIMTFQCLKKLIDEKFGFETALNRPYKLCDFKPAYGFIFEDYLLDYDYWGHCDPDMIFGDMKKMLSPILGKGYDKIFCMGHLSLFHNDKENNSVFMSIYKDKELYKEVYTNPDNMIFDEYFQGNINVNDLYFHCGRNVFVQDLSLNFVPYELKFQRVSLACDNEMHFSYSVESKLSQRCVYDGKAVLSYVREGLHVKKEEYLYVHLQGRKMNLPWFGKSRNMLIVPNRFISLPFVPNTFLKFIITPSIDWYVYLKNVMRRYCPFLVKCIKR